MNAPDRARPVGERPREGILNHSPNAEADILDAVQAAAEEVHRIPFRRRVRSFEWFRRLLR